MKGSLFGFQNIFEELWGLNPGYLIFFFLAETLKVESGYFSNEKIKIALKKILSRSSSSGATYWQA